MSKKNINSFLYRIVCGFFLGISIVAPGISGSVMAIMLGIYDKLIDIAANPLKKFKKTIRYLIPLGIGAGISFVLFALILEFLFDNYPTPAFLLFIALILGSIPTIFKKVKGEPLKLKYIIVAILSFAIALTIGLLEQNQFAQNFNTQSPIYLSICGLIAGMVSVIPGVSISVVLMLLGAYTTLLSMITHPQLMMLIPVGICFVLGLVLFSKLIKHIFERHPIIAFYAVLGFMIGSVVGIIPPLPSGRGEWIFSVLVFVCGLALSILFEHLAKILKLTEEKS